MTGINLRERWLLAFAVGVGAFVLVLGLLTVRDVRSGDQFDLTRWQIEMGWGKWVWVLGSPLREGFDADEVVADYFALAPDDFARRPLENAVESVIEGRIDAVLRELGLSAWVLPPRLVFPPVNIELATSPRVLVTSPREVIERRRTVLLRPDLLASEALAIEAREEEQTEFSALVTGTGGVATYPAIVSDRGSYRGVLSTAAHEWVHHYLVFYPLGIRYYQSADLRAMNETVADIIGDEVAALVLERWGDPTVPPPVTPADPPTAAPSTPPSTPRVNHNEVLRGLRLEVDALLAAGEVDQAERRMEGVRQELEDAGIYFRRINQAFFAWFGTYAARPEATDPLGAYLREIRERSGSLTEFVERIRGLTSRDGVVELLVELGGEP